MDPLLNDIRSQAANGQIRLTQRAHRRMVEQGITLDAALEAIANAQVLEG